MNKNVKILLGFAVGATAGALTGLLMAPRSGDKTRKLVAKEADKLRDTVASTMNETLDQAKGKYSELLKEYTDFGKKSISKAKEKAKLN